MTVQPDLCQTWSYTTLLVFPRDGSDFCSRRFNYIIDKTWDGKPVQHEKVQVSLHRSENAVEIHVEAPFMNDPPAPNGEKGRPFAQLWDYEGNSCNILPCSQIK